MTGRLSRSRAPPLVAFGWRYHPSVRDWLPSAPNARAAGSWSWSPGAPALDSSVERTGPLRFLGTRLRMPCSPIPAGPTRQALVACRRGPAPAKDEGSPRGDFDFGAQSHGLRIAVYASRRGLPLRHARPAPGLLGLARSGWDLHPRGLNERFQWKNILLSQAHPDALAGAKSSCPGAIAHVVAGDVAPAGVLPRVQSVTSAGPTTSRGMRTS